MATHILIIIMGGILAFVVIQMRSKYARLSSGGKAVGTVAAIEVITKKNITIPTPVIQFVTSNNVSVSKTSEASILSPRIKKGTKVKVFYNPQNPEDFIAQSMQFKMTTLVVLTMSIIFVLFGILLTLNDLNVIHLFK